MSIRQIIDNSDFVTAPLLIACLLCISTFSLLGIWVLLVGIVVWTLIEYWMHRALHSKRLLAFHMRHHQRPRADTGGTFYSTLIMVALTGIGLLVPFTAPFWAGLLIGYLLFIIIHFAVHRYELPGQLKANHDHHHHAGFSKMFGVSTSIWDWVFGTK